MGQPQNKSRRGLLLGLLGLSAVAWGWQRYLRRAPDLEFQPIPGLAGWRLLQTRAVTGAGVADAVFLGIGDGAPRRLAPSDLCRFLYPRPGEGPSVAFFTDIQCPNCRRLDAKLNARRNHLLLNRIELPLLGPRSETHARSMLAKVLGKGPGSKEVTAALSRNQAAAETLGIWGTPAMTIGKTLVMGDVPDGTLDTLLAMEKTDCP